MYYVVDNNKIMKRGIENIDLGAPVPIKIPVIDIHYLRDMEGIFF